MDVLDKYVREAEESVKAASNGLLVVDLLKSLRDVESELRSYVASLLKRPDPIKASQQFVQNTAKQRAKQVFLLSYAGGGFDRITGWSALAKSLHLKESSIRVMLSKGKGRFYLTRTNPNTQETDVLSVARVNEQDEVLPAKVGRPRHYVDTSRLGVEFTEGQLPAPSKRLKR